MAVYYVFSTIQLYKIFVWLTGRSGGMYRVFLLIRILIKTKLQEKVYTTYYRVYAIVYLCSMKFVKNFCS